jgi:L-rhamnose-H+ transport protein
VIPNPVFGIPLHWLGGLASGSFYVPYRAVKQWSWETYWLVGGMFSWIVCPTFFALLLTKNLFSVIAAQPLSTLLWTYFFGLLWGFGGLTYGLTMRYLGLSLGTGIALGFCAAFGTLIPPIFKLFMPAIPVVESIVEIGSSAAGRMTLAGVAICFLGIAVAAFAGLKKERELSSEEKQQAIAEFNFFKGLLVATFCGITSACFAFALTAGNPIGAASLGAGTAQLWSGLPKLVVLLWGGFTTNFIWCLGLHVRNRTGHQYFASCPRPERTPLTARRPEGRAASTGTLVPTADVAAPVLRYYLFCAAAGTTWYLQFFFYTMGETQMGRYGFASWTVHMASIIIFATMWGWILHEWKGSSRRVHAWVATGISLLIASTLVIGWGAYLKAQGAIP